MYRLAREGVLRLENCCPVYIHGDEGTTYKKDGCLCVSFHSPFGRGTVSSKKMGPLLERGDHETDMNFVGHAFETRWLLGAMLKESWLKSRVYVFGFMCGVILSLILRL